MLAVVSRTPFRRSNRRRKCHLRSSFPRPTERARDLGDLKRDLLDLWTAERNDLAKRVVLDIEKQRKEAAR